MHIPMVTGVYLPHFLCWFEADAAGHHLCSHRTLRLQLSLADFSTFQHAMSRMLHRVRVEDYSPQLPAVTFCCRQAAAKKSI